MMQVIPKWRVTVMRPGGYIVFYVSDNFLSNVHRKVADLDFGPDATGTQIEMEPLAHYPTSTGTVTTAGTKTRRRTR